MPRVSQMKPQAFGYKSVDELPVTEQYQEAPPGYQGAAARI